MQRTPILAGLIAGLAIGLVAPAPVEAQPYPNKPIKLIVPFAAAGTTDIVARIFAERLGKELGQNVLVENRAGAGGAIGATEIAKSAPDGYTLGMATVSTMAVNPATTAKPAYNNLTDFIPITNIAATPNVLVVHPSLPVKDAKEFVELLKKNPGKYSFASSGAKGIGHMMGELFQLATGTDLIHIAYKGAGPAQIDVLAGTVPVMFDNLPSSKANIDAGKFKLLAVMSPQRLPAYPNVPTMAELGWGEVNDRAWYGLVVPAKTPKEIVDRLYAASIKAINAPDIKEKLIANGAEPVGNTSAEFAAQIKVEFERAKTAVAKRGITLD
jgi:tripartite-type tricarboxylate transporter receptor subunit TctC